MRFLKCFSLFGLKKKFVYIFGVMWSKWFILFFFSKKDFEKKMKVIQYILFFCARDFANFCEQFCSVPLVFRIELYRLIRRLHSMCFETQTIHILPKRCMWHLRKTIKSINIFFFNTNMFVFSSKFQFQGSAKWP